MQAQHRVIVHDLIIGIEMLSSFKITSRAHQVENSGGLCSGMRLLLTNAINNITLAFSSSANFIFLDESVNIVQSGLNFWAVIVVGIFLKNLGYIVHLIYFTPVSTQKSRIQLFNCSHFVLSHWVHKFNGWWIVFLWHIFGIFFIANFSFIVQNLDQG